MEALEFRTLVKDDTIEIPDELKGRVSGHVRVILLQEKAEQSQYTIIDKLLDHPLQLKDFRPLSRDESHA